MASDQQPVARMLVQLCEETTDGIVPMNFEEWAAITVDFDEQPTYGTEFEHDGRTWAVRGVTTGGDPFRVMLMAVELP